MKKEEQHHNSTTRIFQVKDRKKSTYRKPVAVKYLEGLALEAKKMKYPSIPILYLAVPKYKDDSANNLTRCIIAFHSLKSHLAVWISNTCLHIERTEPLPKLLVEHVPLDQKHGYPPLGQMAAVIFLERLTGVLSRSK